MTARSALLLLVFTAIACSGESKRDAGRVCPPGDCSAMGLECGEIDDGRGGCIDCGACVRPNRCGGAGVANVCGCTPATCSSASATCGEILEPCSGTMLACGTCNDPLTCGGGGTPNTCGRMVMLGEACTGPGDRCASGLACCGSPAICLPSAIGGGCPGPLPDLVVDPMPVEPSLLLGYQTFTSTDCAVLDGCVTTGRRRLLRFTTQTPNVGTGDLEIGDPNNPPNNPDFVFSMCHVHYHYAGYMLYRLLASDGSVAAQGFKAAFCLEDAARYDFNDQTVAQGPKYRCNTGGLQGIQRGWADYYGAELDCQWIDVTGLAAGTYQLELTVNPDGRIQELRRDNNVATVPVMIGP